MAKWIAAEKKKCEWPEELGGCNQMFVPRSGNAKYCNHHKNYRTSITQINKGKKKIAKAKSPNSFCPYCENWHYDPDVDEKIKRSFCNTCRKLLEEENSYDDLSQNYKIHS